MRGHVLGIATARGVGQALGPNTGVLFSEPQIEKIDILADKVPA